MDSATTERTLLRPSTKAFNALLFAGWVLLSMAAWSFARARHIPLSIALPAAMAFLTEYPFYLLLGFSELRARLRARWTRGQLTAGIGLSAALPYLVYSVPSAAFQFAPALLWAVMLTATAAWFFFPVRSPFLAALRDLTFLMYVAAIILSGVLRWIFPAPIPKLPLEVLGHITLVRCAMLATLFLRDGERTGIGLIPSLRDLRIGIFWFAACLCVAVPLGLKLGQLHPASRAPAFWPSVGLLLGVYWVLALSEEFFFRGLLQRWLSEWMKSRGAGLIAGSILFSACHLGFRGAFPNWSVAALSLVLGLCCGAAFWQAGSIRASMVTHALAVGAWRLMLS